MKFLAIIPARYASTRFPGKPLALIGGKPMVQWVYERAKKCFEHCCVATDDERIERTVREFGGKAVMTSAEHRSGTDRCAEALGIYERAHGQVFDTVVNIQGDEPFISERQLELIKAVFDAPEVRIATLIKKFGDGEDIFNPNTPKVAVSRLGTALYFSRSVIPYLRGELHADWTGRHAYYKHIGLYAYRADTLREITRLAAGDLEKAESLEQLRWLENGYTIHVRETDSESIAVDTPEDLERLLAKTGTEGFSE